MSHSNDAVERFAVNAVADRINLSPYLTTFIADNDKEPSWDGHIYIYKNENKRKDQLDGRIAVQVKGTEQQVFPDGNISFRMDTADLRNYLNDGGVMLFVVYMRRSRNLGTSMEKKVYYSTLTPIKLTHILASMKKPDQQSINVEAKPLPDSLDDMASICLNCLNDCHKQASFAGHPLPTLEQLERDGLLESITMSVASYGSKNDGIGAFLKYETYLYAKRKGCETLIPLPDMPILQNVTQIINKTISVRGESFFESYELVRSKDKTSLIIGGCLRFSINQFSPQIAMQFESPKLLRERAKALGFILAALNAGKFSIGMHEILLSDDAKSNFDIAEMQEELLFCQRAVETFDKLHCSDDIDLLKLTSEDLSALNRLMEAILDNKPIRGLKENLPYMAYMDIGPLRFLVCLKSLADDPNTYELKDFFEAQLVLSTRKSEQDNQALCVPQYCILRTDDFVRASNIRFDNLLPAFQAFERKPYILELANSMMLELIAAFDITNGYRKEILYQTADAFAGWLLTLPENEWNQQIATLNKWQIVKRKRPLNEAEIHALLAIEESQPEREDILVGVYLLLDDLRRAKLHFGRLNDSQQENFRKYPIYKFWEQLEG